MGIQELIGNMGRKSSASPRIAGGLPAYSKQDTANAELISKELKTIDKLVKSSKANWDKMGAAKALLNVKKALEDVKEAEKAFNDAMDDANSSLEKRAALYEKLAKAKNKQLETQDDEIKKAREAEGMMGRTKNVLKDMAKNWKTLSLGAGFKVLSKVAKDTTENFDILAESSQLTNIGFGELAKSSANYSLELNIASLKAAQFGVSTKESTIAFAKLSKVYGGTREAVNDLGEGWADMVLIAKVSGIGMEAFTDLATQGMMRLGESMDSTKANAVDISKATAAMNQRFGDGSANAKEFTNAVTSLAFAQGFYNQSTKLTIDTLAREVNMQLALGASREAALGRAKENIEMAGEAGILGAQAFTEDLVSGYEEAKQKDLAAGGGTAAQDLFLAEKVGSKEAGTARFGADTKVIEHMLKSGETNLFAMQEMLSGSSAFQQEMLLQLKVAAAAGDRGTLIKYGVSDPKKFEAMIARGSLVNKQLATIASGGTAGTAMATEIFGEDVGEKDTKEFIEKAQEGGFGSEAEMFEAYYKLMDKETSELTDEEGRKENVMEWVKGNIETGWFAGIAGVLDTIFTVLGNIFTAAGVAGTAIGTIAAGGGIAALLGGGAVAATLATAAAAAAAIVAAGAGAYVIYKSFENIQEKKAKGESFFALGKDAEGNDEGGFLGSRASSVLAATAGGAATGAAIGFAVPIPGAALVGAVIGAVVAGGAAVIADLTAAGPEDVAATEEVVAGEKAAKEIMATVPSATVEDGPVGAKGKDQGKDTQVAIATGTVSGKSLILEVTNWDQIYAQAIDDAA